MPFKFPSVREVAAVSSDIDSVTDEPAAHSSGSEDEHIMKKTKVQ